MNDRDLDDAPATDPRPSAPPAAPEGWVPRATVDGVPVEAARELYPDG
jgi:hypothetical protein